MGCDIHMVVERNWNGKWVAIDTLASFHRLHFNDDDPMDGWCSPLARSRNYERFAALANVRGEGPEPRGLPEDASDTTKMLVEGWGGDGHSHTWLPVAEAAEVFLRTERREFSDHARKYPADLFFNVDDEKLDDYRVVFWFDN